MDVVHYKARASRRDERRPLDAVDCGRFRRAIDAIAGSSLIAIAAARSACWLSTTHERAPPRAGSRAAVTGTRGAVAYHRGDTR
jgi:hypothetical protein